MSLFEAWTPGRTGARQEYVKAGELLREEFGYIDLDRGNDEWEWAEVCRVVHAILKHLETGP